MKRNPNPSWEADLDPEIASQDDDEFVSNYPPNFPQNSHGITNRKTNPNLNINANENPKKRPYRNKNNYVALWLSPSERRLWNEKAVEKNLSISQFIRTCVDAVLFHHPEIVKDDSQLQEEITQLRNSMKSLENKYNLDRTAVLSQISQRKLEDIPLEEQIKKHLQGRSLFLNQIAAYCQANPREVLSVLAKMREKRLVEQDPQMRWIMKF